jgi:hypothetical protein
MYATKAWKQVDDAEKERGRLAGNGAVLDNPEKAIGARVAQNSKSVNNNSWHRLTVV